MLISAGIGWAGTLSGRVEKFVCSQDANSMVNSRLHVIDASTAISAYQETALAWPGQEPKRIPSCPG